MIIRRLFQRASTKRFNFVGGWRTRCTHERVPVNFVGVQKVNLRNRRLRHEIQHECTRSAQPNDCNSLFADAVLHRPQRGSSFERVRYLEWPPLCERSGFGVASRRHGTDDLFRIPVNQVARRPVVFRTALPTLLDGNVRPGFSVAVDVVPDRRSVRVVHEPIVVFVGGDVHPVDRAAYPTVRFAARRVTGLLDRARTYDPAFQETRNADCPDNVGFLRDVKPGLFAERGEPILTRHAPGRPRSSCRPLP